MALASCAALCASLSFNVGFQVTPYSCTPHAAGVAVSTASGQSSVGCATSFTPTVDVCQVTLGIKTSGTGNVYSEVWLPNNNASSWNGRTLTTDNGGVNGCVHYVDMAYVTGLGFAAIGDNAGHNGSSFDMTWSLNNNEAIIDWSHRARHAAVVTGKSVVNQFYKKASAYNYYLGCSAGGAQGLQSAQKYPSDFNGIIAGSSANDFNHLQDWSSRFLQLTGPVGDPKFLNATQWLTVQAAIFAQCDKAIDGVDDGILEDPTQCRFDSSVLACNATVTTNCLTSTQVNTVNEVFTELYDTQGRLLYPSLLYGAQYDAFRLGQLSGGPQGIAQDWFRGGIHNDSSFNVANVGQSDYALADSLDNLHGNPSAFSADLNAFKNANGKIMMYHGMADPLVSSSNSQRYYLKVAKTMGLTNTQIDPFLRYFRVAGMAHCGVGGISGAGAWMFGQSGVASSAPNNIITNLVNWVEKGQAPDTLQGTKFWYDTPAWGIQFQKNHCRFPYRTTYNGGDSTKPSGWSCNLISDWQTCAVGAHPRLCNADGTFQ
ncbi:hypothetical protein LTR95_001180 [Oleoguttula sp. CCFEE 5521]